jgi:HSP20 family protein
MLSKEKGGPIMMFSDLGIRNPLYQLRNEVDRLLGGVTGGPLEGYLPSLFRNQPAANIWEREDAFLVEMEIPGVKKEQTEISVLGKELTIRINRPDMEQEGVIYHRRERPTGNFTRVIPLPNEVTVDHVEAELHDGVLTITMPKAENAKPRKITVAG